MVTLLRGADICAPERLGKQDILIEGQQITFIGDLPAEALQGLPNATVIDAQGLTATPGFIDPHVHIAGGGGEGGYANRTPEIRISDIVSAGVTTVIGCLGTDGVTRSHSDLLAKARALETEGITTYIYTGSYQVPARTLTGAVIDDVVLIDKVIGVGEVAISDRRSFQPTVEALAELVSQSHVGGLLSGKAGITHFHVGPYSTRLAPLHRLLDEYPIAPQAVYATHITRSPELLADAVDLAAKGAMVDMTASSTTTQSLQRYIDLGGDLSRLTLSSDANGSLPEFDSDGRLIGMDVAKQTTLYEQVWACADLPGVDLTQAISLVTSNTADVLGLEHKGRLRPGADADILLTDDSHTIQLAFARGRECVRSGAPQIQGTFE
ncbi:beta-aspartyl-peptidase [Brevibacterium sp. UCMA 11752]|uniref:beta-aspartyl-peptidase n=1 Tax=Brevibacterium sp. UCMA 11752 TaxID=2745946 RepID=UPI001F3EF835|nr:beta-aspartyl-peptidase [Brevibacterium sp. UCMA 11752]MCF2588755.1 beta-aspartyl-peptidase [Brevibacterium sp. UCMA 11752]